MHEETALLPLSVRHSTMISAAGEYYVLSRLSLLGKIAAQAPRGVPNADILISSSEGDRLCAIQVKARQEKGSDGGWHMKQKHEGLDSPELFYAFVDFGNLNAPTPVTYIVPSVVVSEVLREMHAAWLTTPGMKGQQRRDTEMRRFMPDYSRTSGALVGRYTRGWLDEYRDAWSRLP